MEENFNEEILDEEYDYETFYDVEEDENPLVQYALTGKKPMSNTLLQQIKWFSIVAIAEDYGYPCDTAEEFKELSEIVYHDLIRYEEDMKKLKS